MFFCSSYIQGTKAPEAGKKPADAYAAFWEQQEKQNAQEKNVQAATQTAAGGAAGTTAATAVAAPVFAKPGSYINNINMFEEKLFKELRILKEVNTTWLVPALRASEPYRKLVYELIVEYAQARPSLFKKVEAAKRNIYTYSQVSEPGLNLEHPEVVLLINRKPACAGGIGLGDKAFRGIEYKQDEADKELFGTTRLTFLHEIAHLSEKHYYLDDCPKYGKLSSQAKEQFADEAAVIVGNCEQCSREFADFFFDLFKARKLTDFEQAISDEDFKFYMTLSVAAVDKMDLEKINKLLLNLATTSLMIKEGKLGTHGFDLERAVRIMRFVKDPKYGIKGSQCTYHKQFGGGIKTKDMFAKIAASDNKKASEEHLSAAMKVQAESKALAAFESAKNATQQAINAGKEALKANATDLSQWLKLVNALAGLVSVAAELAAVSAAQANTAKATDAAKKAKELMKIAQEAALAVKKFAESQEVTGN